MKVNKEGFNFDSKDMEASILNLLSREPFYYYIFMNLNRVQDDRLPAIMAVCIEDITSYCLLYNPTFMFKLGKFEKFMEEIEGKKNKTLPPMEEGDLLCILKHEICHIVLRHVLNSRIKEDNTSWNLATDCCINQMIGGWSEGAKKRFIWPDTLQEYINRYSKKKIKVPPKKDAIYYYNLIRDNIPEDKRNGKGKPNPEDDNKNGNNQGSGDGDPIDDLIDYIGKSHGKWAEVDSDVKDFIEENLRRIVNDAKETCQNAGNMTGDYDFILNTFKKKKTLNWKQLIRRSVSYDVSDLDITFKRPDRRNRSMFPGKKRQEVVDFIWGIDTSGSVSDKDFIRVLNELQKVSRQFNKDKVRIIQIDTEIKSDKVENIRRVSNGKFKFKGRGGTIMDPLFERLRKEKNRLPVILFTDGEFYHDFSTKKYKFPILILLTEHGTDAHVKKAKNCRVVKVLPDKDPK